MKKASLVTSKSDSVRCVYEIEGSNQKFHPAYPDTKVAVSVAKVTTQDLKINFELLNLTVNGKLTAKGMRLIAAKFEEEIASVEGGNLAIDECSGNGGLIKITY
jgi:hypothetical protein